MSPRHVEFTLGTHNLHDEAGRPTGFADVVLFTEALAPRIRDRIALAARGYRLLVVPEQRDLCLLARRRLFTRGRLDYYRAHGGEAGFTPHRGTAVWTTTARATGQPLTFPWHHRINAIDPPYRFEESPERRNRRRLLWGKHRAKDAAIVARALREGRTILAGGDGNRRDGRPVWPASLRERGEQLDRLAFSGDVVLVGPLENLGRAGSDHPRLRQRVRLHPRTNHTPRRTPA